MIRTHDDQRGIDLVDRSRKLSKREAWAKRYDHRSGKCNAVNTRDQSGRRRCHHGYPIRSTQALSFQRNRDTA